MDFTFLNNLYKISNFYFFPSCYIEGGNYLKPLELLKKLADKCDAISVFFGKLISWLIGILILILVYEVISRFVFNKPTTWVYDVSYMIGGAAVLIGAAMALKNNQHVRVDVFFAKLSTRNQLIMDIAFSLLFFFPLLIFGLMNSFDTAWVSWIRKEHIMSGNWKPPIYPLKMVIPFAFSLLIIQGMSELARNILKLIGKEEEKEHGN